MVCVATMKCREWRGSVEVLAHCERRGKDHGALTSCEPRLDAPNAVESHRLGRREDNWQLRFPWMIF